jgi:hypothetical membrane protein
MPANPFSDLAGFLPAALLRAYVLLMIFAVAAGTIFDVVHKGSGKYFAQYRKLTEMRARHRLNGGQKARLAVRTAMIDVAAAGEFCNPKRRISHLLMFYGFLIYLVTTMLMVFAYLGQTTPPILPVLWNVGAVMLLIGGYWFFFLLRVDVAQDGRSPFQFVRADLFIVSMLASVTLALAWEIVQAEQYGMAAIILFSCYVFFTTVLFGSVPWSKFAHMFYKPAMAYQRRVEEADGSSSLPPPARKYQSRI